MESVNEFVQKTYLKDQNEIKQVEPHYFSLCNSIKDFQVKKVDSLNSKLSLQSDYTVPGVPGTFQDVTEAISECFVEYSNIFDKQLMNLWTSLSAQMVQLNEEKFKAHQTKFSPAVNKFNQLKTEAVKLSNSKSQILSRFNKYISDVVNSDSKDELSQFRIQFDEIVKARNSLSKKRSSLMKDSQDYLITVRKESEELSQVFSDYNENLKNYYQTFFDFFTETSRQLKLLAETFGESIAVIDSTNDFKSFIDEKKIVRADFGFEFVPFDTNTPAFAGCKPCPKLSLMIDYPIGMAKVLKNYNADGPNESTIRKGKIVLLVEFPESEWCYIMNPFVWSTGYVPSACLEKVGTKLGAIKGDKLPKSFGNSDDFVAVISEDDSSYLIENLYGQQISAPKDCVSLVFV